MFREGLSLVFDDVDPRLPRHERALDRLYYALRRASGATYGDRGAPPGVRFSVNFPKVFSIVGEEVHIDPFRLPDHLMRHLRMYVSALRNPTNIALRRTFLRVFRLRIRMSTKG
jgi:hypothetical protein